MKILSIETSCDETAVSLLSVGKTKVAILGNALISQAKLHEEYGGVFPNLARREHQKNLTPLLFKALDIPSPKVTSENQNKISKTKIAKTEKILEREPELLEHFRQFIFNIKAPKIDKIAVTKGPGLEPALWVGISFANALSELWDIPVQGINHMEGHIAAELIEAQTKEEYKMRKIKFPALALLVSGGHTELVLIKKFGSYSIVGKTRDDAVGEAFDKVARILGLPYPGGPEISKRAEALRKSNILPREGLALPRPMIHSKDFDFSFSGLKTAVLYLTKKIAPIDDMTRDMICLEFETASVETLVSKTRKAIESLKIKTLIVGGGVSANTHLKNELKRLQSKDLDILLPEKDMATDNAVMIGIVGGLKDLKKKKEIIHAEGNLSL